MNKVLIAVVAVVVIGAAGLIILPKKKAQAPTTDATMSQMQQDNASKKTDDTVARTNDAASSDVTIDIKDFAYSKNVTVKKGTKVTWTNQDSTAHTVSADTGSPAGGPDSGTLKDGESYSMTFNTVGTFNYNCKFHSSMKGNVAVVE